MKFQIVSRERAEQFSQSADINNCAIISIADTKAKNAKINLENPKIKDVLFLHFDDMESGEPNCMTHDDAEAILSFAKKWHNHVEELIVHCHGGVSRSAGVCAALKFILTGDDWDVFTNPRYCPNPHCYKSVLAANGTKTLDVLEEKIQASDNLSLLSNWDYVFGDTRSDLVNLPRMNSGASHFLI